MKTFFLTSLTFFTLLFLKPQTEGRIKIVSIVPSENTGQDYSSWLSDDLDNLVPSEWGPGNNKYTDVILELEKKSIVSKISFYDYEGIFTDNPVSLYAMNGTTKTFLGIFEGLTYKNFVDLTLNVPIVMDAILIHKFRNNIPQKIFVYGETFIETTDPSQSTGNTPQVPSVIHFDELPAMTLGNEPFVLIATSNNTETPITFTSDNPSVVSVANVNGNWMATINAAGVAGITASQPGSNRFSLASVKKSLVVLQPNAGELYTGKIPIDPKRWYQLTNASNGLDGLFDGKTNEKVETGWGKVLNRYDSYYPIADDEELTIESIKFYDGEGTNHENPMTLYSITDQGEKIHLATFTGGQYNTWVGPDPAHPTHLQVRIPVKNSRYLMINSWNSFPTEIEFYGTYKLGKPIGAAVKRPVKLEQTLGINAFEWDFEHPNEPNKIDEQRMKAIKNFTSVRHYMDWEKLESTEGSYSFNPTMSGGWNYDAIYERCKAEGIEVLACLKTIPAWMQKTYPGNERDYENVPLKYGKNFSDPQSYIEQAKVAFQYIARYGSNTSVDRSLLKLNTSPRWNGDVVNTIKVGLDLIKYIECENERDKWWKGRKAYQTAYEYAANLSAFYDGHKNSMGPGVGVKNADPNIKVVMGGVATPNTEYLRGMVEWCRQNRGYKANGKVNLCWDIINYHYYPNDAKSSQGGGGTRGAAPELSDAGKVAQEFIETAHKYAENMPVWVTETGYDVNQSSPYKAIAIGSKSILETQADWILRTSLLYARSGVERVFFYQLYDDNPLSNTQFSSSGLINSNRTRRPAADYLFQTKNLLGQFIYKETINSNPIVDRYEHNGQSAYALVVPDEKGRTTNYTLHLGAFDSATIFSPKTGSDVMDKRSVKLSSQQISITVTETPLFILPYGTSSDVNVQHQMGSVKSPSNDQLLRNELASVVQVYPNPTTEFITLSVQNKNKNDVTVKISEAGSGRVVFTSRFQKNATPLSKKIKTNSLPKGLYLLEVIQGSEKVTKKIVKN
ncbi:MAG TPA: T9SS type A sorting domain-containing protein [Chitinophagaceae bacterium]|nr:T9SS type A sorting domain-containing protein [Chitinophagaceae bacterium]